MIDEAVPVVAPAPKRGAGRWLKPTFGFLVSGFFLYVVFSRLSFHEVIDTLSRSDLRMIPLAIGSLACGYAARITRWWLMLSTRAPRVRWLETASPFLISIAANNILPLRIGDILRLFAFQGRPGLESSHVAATLLVERLLDLMVLLAIFALVLTQVTISGPLAKLVALGNWAAAAGVLAAVAIISLPMLDHLLFTALRESTWALARPWASKVLTLEAMLAQTIADIGRPSRLAALLSLSLVVWAFEGGLFVAVLAAFDTTHTVVAAIFALAVATLATLVPSSPGYIGTFHFFAIQALLVFGLKQNMAAAFAITAHLLLWLPTTLAGLIAFCWTIMRPNQYTSMPRLHEVSSEP